MEVYIVRHGEVPHNAFGIYNGSDEDLTDKGIMQALDLRDKLKDIKFDVVIASPLLRTIHTENILTYYDDSIITDNRLRERDCGDLSGKPLEVTNKEEYWNYYTNIQYGTSENIQDFFKRVYNLFR